MLGPSDIEIRPFHEPEDFDETNAGAADSRATVHVTFRMS
jgi:hypothetical protein